MRVQNRHKRAPRIEMIPLIDVVFLLLVVFIYAMLSMAVHKALPVALPTSTAAQIDRQTLISITVTAQGDILVNKTPVALAALAAMLRQRIAADPQTAVMLFADRALAYQELFRVLDQVRLAGVTRIQLQAEGVQRP